MRARLIGTMAASLALAAVVGVIADRGSSAPEATGGVVGVPVAVSPARGVPGSPSTPIESLAAPAPTTAPTTATTAAPTTTTTRRPAAVAPVKPRKPGPGTVQSFTMPSGDSDGHRRAFWVYRPGVPDSADLPVAYFLHGYPGNEKAVAQTDLAWTLERLFAAGVPPFVVVVPNGQSASRPDTEWADSVDGKVRLESFVVDNLVPAVEGANRRDRAHRAIFGFSMGGFGAMNIGLHHPDLFGHIVSIAGYFRIDDPDGMGRHDPQWEAANSPDRHVAAGAGSRVLLISAAEEHDDLILGEAQRFRRLAEGAGQHPQLVVAPGPHLFTMVIDQLPTVARFLGAAW